MSEVALLEHLRTMYCGQLPTVVTDSAVALSWGNSLGLPTLALDELPGHRPDAAIVFICTDTWYNRLSSEDDYFRNSPVSSLDGYLEGSRVLWFPFTTFDGSDNAVSYGLRLLEKTDFASLPGAHEEVFTLLSRANNLHVTDDRGTNLSVQVADDEIEFVTISDLTVDRGNDFLAAYFEVEFIWLDAGRPTFVPDGVIRPAGVLAAHTQRFTSTSEAVQRARDFVIEAATATPSIDVADGQVTRIELDGTDVTEEFARLAGPNRGLMITEFAFGTNNLPTEVLSWDINSPLNEGVRGIHLAIGDGESGIHFDFVCAGAHVS